MAVAANLTKVDAGGSGDNIVPDGLIKSVEKVWIDSYAYTSTATIGIGTIIEIASIHQGKKITGIEVFGIGALSVTSTNAISIGTKMMGLPGTPTNATLFLAATTFGTASFNNFTYLVANTGIGTELTGGANRIFLYFTGANPSVTGGTITTKVRWV